MKDNMVKKNILMVVGKVAEIQANIVDSSWPPKCAGLLHQPKRPKKK